jgi:hypothetical protein
LWKSFIRNWKNIFIKDTNSNLWIINGITIHIYFLYVCWYFYFLLILMLESTFTISQVV